MLVAIDLSLHVNDTSNILQAVVNCYGLLAPIIYHQMPSEPIIEVTVVVKCDHMSMPKSVQTAVSANLSGSAQVLHSPPGDPRTAQAETSSNHCRVPPAHGRMYDVLFSQGTGPERFGHNPTHNVLDIFVCVSEPERHSGDSYGMFCSRDGKETASGDS